MSKLTSAMWEKSELVTAEILTERCRQIEGKGYDHAHDDALVWNQLATAAAQKLWGVGAGVGVRENQRRELIHAAALIVAEIERFDRTQVAS